MRTIVLGCLILLLTVPEMLAEVEGVTYPLPPVEPAEVGLSEARLDRLHATLGGFVDQGRYSGYISLIARRGRVADWRATGWQDVAEGIPLQRDSIVRIYSMSKIVTSVGILMLMEEGRLRLNDPVATFLPVLAKRQVYVSGAPDEVILTEVERPVTIKDLLTHTSGDYYPEEWSASPEVTALAARVEADLWQAPDLGTFINILAQLPLHEQPGTRFRYGMATDILGAVIEHVSGQSLDTFFRERIFGPLGMPDTGFVVPAEKRHRLALLHERDPAGKLTREEADNQAALSGEAHFFSGGGGLFSTAPDYTRFAQMLLNKGELEGVRLLGRKTVELMTRNHLEGLADPHPFGNRHQGFGLGVRVYTQPGQGWTPETPGTFGWDGAASTVVQIDPVEQTVALLLLQHFPFNEGDVHAYWTNLYHSALVD